MLIELNNALLDTSKVNGFTHVEVYKKDTNKHWEYRGSFGIEGGASKTKVTQIYEENKEEF